MRSLRAIARVRSLAPAALVILSFALSGCALRSLLPAGTPAAARTPKADRKAAKNADAAKRAGAGKAGDAPAPSRLDQRLADAAEQAALAPAEPYWPYRAAELLVEADSLARAESSLRAALARDARYAPALALLSRLQFEAGRHEEAVRMLEPAVLAGEAAAAPELLAALALHYDALDRVTEAAALARRANQHGAAPEAAAYLALRGDRPDTARRLAEEALDRGGRSAANHNNAGIVKLRAGDPDGARRSFLRAIELDPTRAGPYYNLAILEKFYRFDDGAAVEWFRAYWARSRQDPDSLRAQISLDPPKDLAGGEGRP